MQLQQGALEPWPGASASVPPLSRSGASAPPQQTPRKGPKEARSSVLTPEEEAIVVAFRRHTLLPLDDCLYGLQPTIPHLTLSALHRCLARHGISRLPQIGNDKPPSQRFATYAMGYFHIDLAEVSTAQGKLGLFVVVTAPASSPSPASSRTLAKWRRRTSCAT